MAHCARICIPQTGKLQKEQCKMNRKMRQHRNDALFNTQRAGELFKWRKTILKAIRSQIKIKFQLLRMDDKKPICKDYEKSKTWTTPMLENWLKNINTLRERSHQYRNKKLRTITASKKMTYIERKENLKQFSSPKFCRWRMKQQFSSPKFCRWRMKHHALTLTQYVHLKKELERQLKQQQN